MNTEDRWKFEKVPIELIDEASENANKMSGKDFDKLCRNIGVSGLSSVPCCYKTAEGRYTLISGHHRVRACRKLKHKTVGILYVNECELSRDEIIAIQLSHNSLHGEDDRSILKSLFSQIESIDFRSFANVDIDDIGSMPSNSLDLSPISEIYTSTIIVYSQDLENFEPLLSEIQESVKKSDVVILAGGEGLEETFQKVKKEVSKIYDIKSANTTFSKILELAYKQLKLERNDLDNNDEER